MARASLIGIDWGTSSFRAWLMTAEGEVLDAVETASGILVVPGGAFDAVFEAAVGHWLAADPGLPLIASGMITSRNGWCETPYLPLPVSAEDLARSLTPLVTAKARNLRFVTGIARNPHTGLPDVMRGEETELTGHMAAGGSGKGLFVMPGTHSKWVRTEAGAITDFETYMTGELFAVLSCHSILGRLMKPGPGSPSAFREGVGIGRAEGASILAKIFSARSLVLFDRLQADEVADYLSGLLIGAEVAAGLARHHRAGTRAGTVTIIGRGDLADRYRIALTESGIEVVSAQPGMARRGLLEIARKARMI